MNVPYALALAAIVVQLGSKGPVGVAMAKTTGRYDNKNPRDQQALLEGAGKRALAAHANGWEALPPFLAGVVAAVTAGGNTLCISAIAAIFLVARIIYIPLYIKDIASPRSLVWGTGMLATMALWIVALLGK